MNKQMRDKIFIGLTPTKEISQIKAGLNRDYHKSSVLFKFPNSHHISYRDKNYAKQLREEVWEEVGSTTLRIALIRSVKNNIIEGEQISIIWD
jgi:hypothetical protein